jgi:hypothetical protein
MKPASWRHMHAAPAALAPLRVGIERRLDVSRTLTGDSRGSKAGSDDIASIAWPSEDCTWLLAASPYSGLAAFNLATQSRAEVVQRSPGSSAAALRANAVAARATADEKNRDRPIIAVSVVNGFLAVHTLSPKDVRVEKTRVSDEGLAAALMGSSSPSAAASSRNDAAVESVAIRFAPAPSSRVGVLVTGPAGSAFAVYDVPAVAEAAAARRPGGALPAKALVAVVPWQRTERKAEWMRDFAWLTKDVVVAGRARSLAVIDVSVAGAAPRTISQRVISNSSIGRVVAAVPTATSGAIVAVHTLDDMLLSFAVDSAAIASAGRHAQLKKRGREEDEALPCILPLHVLPGLGWIDDLHIPPASPELLVVGHNAGKVLCVELQSLAVVRREAVQPPRGGDYETVVVAARNARCFAVGLGNTVMCLRN